MGKVTIEKFLKVEPLSNDKKFNMSKLTGDLINMNRYTPVIAHRYANFPAYLHDHDYCLKSSSVTFLDGVNKADCVKRSYVQKHTINQSGSEMWHSVRKSRITASMVHDIIATARNGNFAPSYAQHQINGTFIGTAAVKWGQAKENNAFNDFNETQTDTFLKCGIFIDPEMNYLAASPDGINTSKTKLLEIKCPYSIRLNQANEAPYLDQLKLKRNHRYYTQVQFQMHVTGIHVCDFLVWTTQNFIVDTILYDSEFVSNRLPFVKSYYEQTFAPTYVDILYNIDNI